jgi:hypothetical protein
MIFTNFKKIKKKKKGRRKEKKKKKKKKEKEKKEKERGGMGCNWSLVWELKGKGNEILYYYSTILMRYY